MRCPGQDMRNWTGDVVFETPCPACGVAVEFFKDEGSRRCSSCGHRFSSPKIDLSCAEWCEHAEECFGYVPERKERTAVTGGEGPLASALIREMKAVFGRDQKRIGHALAVFQHAKALVRKEGGDPRVVLAAAILHDVGILEAERKHGSAAGRYREIEGPPTARKIMEDIGLGAQLFTEEFHIVNKLFKGVLGTNNVEANARLCMASAVNRRFRCVRRVHTQLGRQAYERPCGLESGLPPGDECPSCLSIRISRTPAATVVGEKNLHEIGLGIPFWTREGPWWGFIWEMSDKVLGVLGRRLPSRRSRGSRNGGRRMSRAIPFTVAAGIGATRTGLAAASALLLAALPAYAIGTRDAVALQAMSDFAAGRRGVVCWCSRRTGAVRIWGCDFDGANLRQISPDVSGKDHIGPQFSPDGTRIAYLEVSSLDGSSLYTSDVLGDLMVVDSNAATGPATKLVGSCRRADQWRICRWVDDDRIAYVGSDHQGYVYRISTGTSTQIVTGFVVEDTWSYGPLPNPQLTHAIGPGDRISRINGDRTLTVLKDIGCEGILTDDGKYAVYMNWIPHRAMVVSVSEDLLWTLVPESRLPSGQQYMYFPKLSVCQRFAAVGASDGTHNHWTADYDIFVVPMNPTTLQATGDAVKYAFGTGSDGKCLDSWPDVWVESPGANDPPTVSITSPSDGATFAGPADITIQATASDTDGSVTKVEFYNGGTKLGEDSSSPYQYNWTGVGAGGYSLTAKATDDDGALTTSAAVSITVSSGAVTFPMRINCGTNEYEVAGWERDDAYVSGGADFTFAQPADTTGVADAAPADVYITLRHGPVNGFSMSFPQVPDGTYTVRFHFYDQPHSDLRKMDVTVEGVKVLDDFCIATDDDGKVAVKDFEVTVSDGDGLQIVGDKDTGNDVFWSALEIIEGGAGSDTVNPTISIDSPSDGDTVSGGIVVSGAASDNTAVADVEVWVDSDAPSAASGTTSWTWTLDTTALADGAHTVSARATDSSGNTATDAITIYADNGSLEPSITILSPAGGEIWYVGTTRRVEWESLNVNQVVIQYSTQGGGSGGWNQVGDGMATLGDPDWQRLEWVIPDDPSTQCVINIEGYLGEAPTKSALFEIRAVTDSDGDGMDDGWEMDTFGHMDQDGTTDADGDGMSDYDEFMAGTDPLVGEGTSGVGFGCVPGGGATGLTIAVGLMLVILRRRSTR